MKKPGFSVLMSLYHAEKESYLDECLNSLNSQELKANEVVLVLDGPVSKELSSVVEFWTAKLNIQVIPLKNNVGLSKALNHGLGHCKYELVARMDTDDVCKENRFVEQLNYMVKHQKIDVLGSFCEDISEIGCFTRIRKVPIEHDKILKNIWTCPFIHPSVMFRKSKIIEVGSYSEVAPHRQDDFELWIRSANHGLKFANIPKALIKYRVPDNAYQKNTIGVGINRIKIGYKAVYKYNCSVAAFLGLCYPLVRSMMPYFIQVKLVNIARLFDPRR